MIGRTDPRSVLESAGDHLTATAQRTAVPPETRKMSGARKPDGHFLSRSVHCNSASIRNA